MVGEWMMDPIKIPWFRHPGSSWSLVYLVRGGSRPNLTEGSLSAAMGCFVQGYLVDLGWMFEMFHWQRPDDLPPSEPSEAAIWAAIDRHDPEGSADVQDRLEQHQDMLQGRDTFHGFFTRSPLLSECSEGSVVFEDPDRWVTSLRLQCGEYHPLESSVAQVGWGTCDVLVPAADVLEPVGQSGLLSHRQLQSAPLEWPRDSAVGRVQSLVSGYVCWARYVLLAHRGTLQEAGIYEAVYTSLFDYGRLLTSWARGLVEFWDTGRGTCWVGAEELTLTLSDL
ncbi:hypothetical protein M5K25_020621 [Dendrobium thyrsiflorum]|uniref:Uncharacterized protein n=1 Tax=Dendrobium thyrsiflorum TaxID=117978 RepID=A0ABD0UAI4_DENTH